MTTLSTHLNQFWDALQQPNTSLSTLMPIDRIDVYRQSAQGGWAGALEKIYPACRFWVGEKCFGHIAQHFRKQFGQTSPNLNLWGSELSSWLHETPIVRDCPYLPELAWLEWALHCASGAPRLPSLSYSALAQQERLTLKEGVFLAGSRWPIWDLWCAFKSNAPEQITLEAGPQCCVIWLCEQTVKCQRIEVPAFQFWVLSNTTRTLQEAIQSHRDPLTENMMGQWITEAISNEWLQAPPVPFQ